MIIQTKFDIGDKIWFWDTNALRWWSRLRRWHHVKISSISIKISKEKQSIAYYTERSGDYIAEENAFHSKRECKKALEKILYSNRNNY